MQITVTESGEKKVEAKDGTIRLDENKNRLLSHDGSTNLLFIGQRSDGSIGWDLAPPGVEVTTASPDDLTASDRFNLFKIIDSDVVTLDSPSSIGTSTYVNVTHTVGHNPMVWAFASFSPTGTGRPLPYLEIELVAPTPGIVNYSIDFETVGGDTVTFFWRRYAGTAPSKAYIRYYIVQETASYS